MGSSSDSASVDIVHVHSVSPEIPSQGLGCFKACLVSKQQTSDLRFHRLHATIDFSDTLH